MPMQIIAVDNTDLILIQETDNPTNRLHLADLSTLLLLRARIEDYIRDLQPDARADTPPVAPNALISTSEARAIAKERGHPLPLSALGMAIHRGTLKGAYKEQSRWIIPRANFETWLARYAKRTRQWPPRQRNADGKYVRKAHPEGTQRPPRPAPD